MNGVIFSLFISAMLSWASNIGYTGQHQAPLFLRQCFFLMIFSAPFFINNLSKKLSLKISLILRKFKSYIYDFSYLIFLKIAHLITNISKLKVQIKNDLKEKNEL